MRIAVAQTRPVRGDIAANVAGHLGLVEHALQHGAEVVVFPELSLTGYEPALARDLALGADDPRLDGFQRVSDTRRITIAVGAPTPAGAKPCISLAVFQPGRARWLYSKQHLHADEEPYFAPGVGCAGFLEGQPRIALAICYELSVPEHAAAAFQGGAGVYLASVAKTARGVEQASTRLAALARQHAAPVLMANCVGPSGDGVCAGTSSVWNRRGELLAQLDGTSQGLLVFDSEEQRAFAAGSPQPS